MRFRTKPWLALIAIAVAVIATVFLIRRLRRGVVESDAEMVALLPRRDLISGFVNVDLLRRAGLLKLLQASKPEQDPDYERFVRDSGFDYGRDVRAIAGAANAKQIFLVVRGTFDWARLREYAARHGGTCNSAFCQAPTSRPGRWASFLRIDSDVAGLAIGAEPADVLLLSPRKPITVPQIPGAPVWINVPHSAWAGLSEMPLAMRLLAAAVEPADRVILSAEPGKADTSAIQLRLEAVCQNAAVANAIRTQLQIDTNLLKMELKRERQEASRSDLTGMLTAGTFQQSGNKAIGTWPVYRDFLDRLK